AQDGQRLIEAGKRIPGIPRADGFAELSWRDAGDRVRIAAEVRVSDSVATDDGNTDAAPGYARFALRGQWRPSGAPGWRAFARIDNLFDRDYIGSVIVNDRNGRFFEPGAGRNFTVGFGFQR
ncbi:MAG: TonB-dependent receptor domain-containing protein, partial [Luteimonas sp.]